MLKLSDRYRFWGVQYTILPTSLLCLRCFITNYKKNNIPVLEYFKLLSDAKAVVIIHCFQLLSQLLRTYIPNLMF